ncbi:hypothetical protein C8Q70DRAFT_1000129 [Cubamyces menziesii]|nr:hypothetical protein C8Q70DRAFT_1000129 [Cubamyces menziesii]
MSATTLAFSRVCRTTASRYATRSLGTEALASSDSTSATLPPRGSATSKARPPSRTIDRFTKSREVPRGYSVYVRPWDHIDGMPAFLAMVRALEKQFGRVREFRVPRNPDVPSQYLDFFIAEFAEEESFKRVPEKGTHIKVEVPVSRRDRPGGVGLDELQGLLLAAEFDPDHVDFASPQAINPFSTPGALAQRPTRTVEIVVQRSEQRKIEEVYRRPLQHIQKSGLAFYRWGGFYQPSDGEPSLPPAMRAALSKWKDVAATRFTSQTQRPRDPTSAQGVESVVENLDTPAPESDYLGSELRESESEHSAADSSREPDTTLSAAQSPSDKQPDSPAAETTAQSASARDVTAPVQDASTTPPQSAGLAPTDTPAPETARPARLSQRERILMLARQHAKTPLPDPAVEEQKAAEAAKAAEEEQKMKEENRGALLGALKKLMGGRW